MTLIETLLSSLDGKKVIGGQVPPNMIGGIIMDIRLDCYDSLFRVYVKQPNGALEMFDILEDWDIQVE